MSPKTDPAAHPTKMQGADHRERDRRYLLGQAGHQRARVARNLNEVETELQTPGVRLADSVTGAIGPWPFILVQSGILAAWIVLNGIALHKLHAELRALSDTQIEVLSCLPSLPTRDVRRDGTASQGEEDPR